MAHYASLRTLKKGRKKRDAFLQAYSTCGVISYAAVAAGCTRHAHAYWLKHDPEYPKLFLRADAEAADSLLSEARRQALDGIKEPVIYQGKMCGNFVDMAGNIVPEGDPRSEGFVPLTVNRKNPILLIFLINRHDKRTRVQEETLAAAGARHTTLAALKKTQAFDYDEYIRVSRARLDQDFNRSED